MALVLFDGIAVSNTGSSQPANLVVDPRYYIKAQPKIRVIKSQLETRNIKG